jgi:hypothetical protein
MGTVIEREFYFVDGHKVHRDVPRDYEFADKIHGARLDRRKSYAVILGSVCESVSWSQACSGCYEGWDIASAKGMGCHECGHTGRARLSMWVPKRSVYEESEL